MIKELKYINLEYNECDKNYIDELIDYINLSSEEITNFFSIDSFNPKVEIKLYDYINKFNEWYYYFNKKEAPLWFCGFSFKMNGVYHINVLSLEKYKKTQGHEKHNLNDLKCLIMHEFVHSCVLKINNSSLPAWLNEGIAIKLSHQYDNKEYKFNASLNEMINGCNNYINYYTMFSYVIDKYGKDYILDLILNNKAFDETEKLYNDLLKSM